jgi:hypothetical protein
LDAAVQVGSLVLFPTEWFDSADLARASKRWRNSVSGKMDVIGYVVSEGPSATVPAGKFCVDCGGTATNPVQQIRSGGELQPLLAPAAQAPAISAKFFTPPEDSDRGEESSESAKRDSQLRGVSATHSVDTTTLATNELIDVRTPQPHPTRHKGAKLSGEPPKEPVTLTDADLHRFCEAWDAKLREMTAAAYSGGDIVDDDGPIETHQSPYCKSVEIVRTTVIEKMRGCALAQSRICGAYSVHTRSWHCSFGVSEYVMKQPVVHRFIKAVVALKRSCMKAMLNQAGALHECVCVGGGGGGGAV